MDKKLHLLESFGAKGSDGSTYKVMGYEHMVRTDAVHDGQDHWEPTGQVEYRLDGGEAVQADRKGLMRIAASGVELKRETAEAAAAR